MAVRQTDSERRRRHGPDGDALDIVYVQVPVGYARVKGHGITLAEVVLFLPEFDEHVALEYIATFFALVGDHIHAGRFTAFERYVYEFESLAGTGREQLVNSVDSINAQAFSLALAHDRVVANGWSFTKEIADAGTQGHGNPVKDGDGGYDQVPFDLAYESGRYIGLGCKILDAQPGRIAEFLYFLPYIDIHSGRVRTRQRLVKPDSPDHFRRSISLGCFTMNSI